MIIWNPIGALCLVAWHLVTAGILFTALHRLDLFRVPSNQEVEGLDIIKHDEPAYGFGNDLQAYLSNVEVLNVKPYKVHPADKK